ncbi:MAG TPA: hypothetical protein VM366_05365, partial [Anaerolineae bacterium]|nr:hypothetical protein [Anaerolineae bacterium]
SYSVARFLLEFIRLDAAAVGRIAIAQIVALVIIAAFSVFLAYQVNRHKRGDQSPPSGGKGQPESQPAPSPEDEGGLGVSPQA